MQVEIDGGEADELALGDRLDGRGARPSEERVHPKKDILRVRLGAVTRAGDLHPSDLDLGDHAAREHVEAAGGRSLAVKDIVPVVLPPPGCVKTVRSEG